MSLVARFFVVLNLIVSVVFLVFAMNVWTAQTKWQRMYEDEKTRNVEWLARHQKLQVELSRDVVRSQELVGARNEEIKTLKFEKNRLREDVADIQAKLAKKENELDGKEAKYEEEVRENKRLKDELVRSKGVIAKQQQAVIVERNNATEARNEKSALESELNVTKQTLAALQRDKRAIEEESARNANRIQRLLEKNVPVWELLNETATTVAAGPVPDAQVLFVRPDLGLVMISAGSQQNVKPGVQFTISRGDQYIAKVQVDKVYPDMSSARIIGSLSKGEVQIHDEAKAR